jgi:RNAse (barnase) inhibitor barstar
MSSKDAFSQKFKLPMYYQKFLNIDSLIDNTPEAVYFYPEVNIYPHAERRTRRSRKRYEKLVRNFLKVYPYALEISEVYTNIDDTLAMFSSDDSRKLYLNVREKQIMSFYKPKLKKLTLSQGVLLVKLMDRESGETAYKIVDDLRGSVTAVFWQTFALMFGNSLKTEYDASGDDKDVEYLVKRYEDGTL